MSRGRHLARRFLTSAMVLGLAGAHAQAPPLQGIRVHMHGAEGYAADGSMYSPKGAPPYAAVVLVPDERGITARVTEAAGRLVEQGFLVVALDLNRGLAPAAATHSDEQSLHDLEASLAFLGAQATVKQDAVGLLGWDSGGSFALRFAQDARIKAVATVDATQLPAPIEGSKTGAALLVSFGGLDTGTKHAAQSFEKQAKKLGGPLTVKTYPHAEAGFDDAQDAAHYRAADAADLAQRQAAFFSKYLHR